MVEVDYLKRELNRDQLEEFAALHGVEHPESYENKTKLAEAVAEDVTEENVEAFLVSDDDDSSQRQAITDAQETAKANAKTEDVVGAERDGTKELERKESAAEARQKAVQAGIDTAKANAEAEREANQ